MDRLETVPHHPAIKQLRRHVRGEVDTQVRRRAEYATDASNYRIIPAAVAYPANREDLATIIQVCGEHNLPLAMRGAGTSIAGNAISSGIVVDTTRHLNQILEVDTTAKTAVVEPGVVMSDLHTHTLGHQLRFGPDPSTFTRATFGGMIGNNACGPHAVAWGKTAENVLRLECLDGRARSFTAAAGPDALAAVPGLEAIVTTYLAHIRTELGRFSRQVSGYSLEHLLPERGRDLAKALVGSEASLAVVTEAEIQLVTTPTSPHLVVLGYDSMVAAADAVPALLAAGVIALEGFDAKLVDYVIAKKGAGAVPHLPAGRGWLLAEVAGETAAHSGELAAGLQQSALRHGAIDTAVYPPGPTAASLWKIRADGAGLAGRTPAGNPAWPGWEDAAVPPENLGAYLRDFHACLDEFGLDGLVYGHFGDGCVHVRIDFPLDHQRGRGVLRQAMQELAQIVFRHGGSPSGEHGDGRARSELLTQMYSPPLRRAFQEVKALFDPLGILNPGILAPSATGAPIAALDEDLRLPQRQELTAKYFHLPGDGSDLGRAVHRCTGVGKCRVTGPGHVMCPSYRATRDEKNTTRARARILQEVTQAGAIASLDAAQVRESLELCLACKACASDCPTGIDMARYKAEVLAASYAGKLRPLSHYTLGWLPRWIRLLTNTPGAARLASLGAQLAGKSRSVQAGILRAGGMSPERELPSLERESLRSWMRRQDLGEGSTAVLWADTFSHLLDSRGARDTFRVMKRAGHRVYLAPERACCGLTYITTGQLDRARAAQLRLIDTLAPVAAQGIPIVGVEPSCIAAVRDDMPDLHHDDPRARLVARHVYTLAEFLTDHAEHYVAPDLSGRTIVAQPHCHHYAIMQWDTDAALLRAAGARVEIAEGCCGMAGNFGMEPGHYDISRAVANTAVLPLLDAHCDAQILADGFSCRTQIDQLAGRSGAHLATLLANVPQ
ncbi:MAG: FAD-binding and (Fe-S)-binding domain-containing protein [Bowdeniella nasicola]|nr:FAD-binding and (Fe-S)-binding domain-containing protein [Bowdeniella nasicola]